MNEAIEFGGPPLTVQEIVAQAWSTGFSLKIDLDEVCFLVGICARMRDNEDTTLEESHLRQIYPIIGEMNHTGDPASLSQRATNAIARLREQRLLIRTDAGGVTREGQYALSQLGTAIAEWVITRETLNSDDLQVMMRRIRADLAQVKEDAAVGGDDAYWKAHVVAPLRLTVAGIIEMIDQRKRGLDTEHADIRDRISKMLEEAWLSAIGSCEELLEKTSGTLYELNRVLGQEVEAAAELLNEIEDRSYAANRGEVQNSINAVRRHIEQLTAWADNRLKSWSEFYQRVHEFIRSVVQFDPERAVRYRLRESIREFGMPPWGLSITDQPSYLQLREVESRKRTERVQRPTADRTRTLEDVRLEPDVYERIRERLAEKIEAHDTVDLRSFLQELLPECGRDRLYVIIGRVVEQLVHSGRITGPRTWEWSAVGEGVEVQNLSVSRRPRSALEDQGAATQESDTSGGEKKSG